MTIQQAFVLLAALAGAAHVLAPDHWLPASLLAWQKRWGLAGILIFSFFAYFLHVVFGFMIFIVGIGLFRGLLVQTQDLLLFSLILIVVLTLVRAMRFSRIMKIQKTAANRGFWALLSVLSLLGPAESVIPIFIKADQLGIGYLLPLLAFFAGTFIAGALAVAFGRSAWNRPFWLPRGLEIAHKKMAAFPVIVLVAIGISFLSRIAG